MNYLPPRHCMVLLDDGIWHDAKYDAVGQDLLTDGSTVRASSQWLIKATGEEVPLDRVVGWGERPAMSNGILTFALKPRAFTLAVYCFNVDDYLFVDTQGGPLPRDHGLFVGYADYPEVEL